MAGPIFRPKMPDENTKLVRTGVIIAIALAATWTFVSLLSRGPNAALVARSATDPDFRVASWNIAAINNNPFEYWITHDDAAYNKMMIDVQDFIETPGSKDVRVSDVFTQKMFDELKTEMQLANWDGIVDTEAQWQDNFKDRLIISGFMKDGTLGDKRLASMPDRTTNTIKTMTGEVYRPTVINCYKGDLSTVDKWWLQWKTFIFKTKVTTKGKSGGLETKDVSSLLIPIKKSKYPAVTEEEERISIPLQTLAGGIFDAILVHIANEVAPAKWQALRGEMCAALNLKKTEHTLGIIQDTYSDVDVFFLQEVATTFIETAGNAPGLAQFKVLAPDILGKRDQNSVMFLRKEVFNLDTITFLTDKVWEEFGDAKVPVAAGDILAISVEDKGGEKFMLVSFHGDTNGLATIAVTKAVNAALGKLSSPHKLVFGLDANTYEHAKPGKTQDVLEYAAEYTKLGLTSVWGNHPDPTNHTTYNARTFLQPQLNKAARKSELVEKGDVNPKDFILFQPENFVIDRLWKDNTGVKSFVENMVFPTLKFPSDHGVLSARLVKQPGTQGGR